MFSPIFDWVLAGIAGVLAVLIFFGKGGGVLRFFESRNSSMVQKKKVRTPEQELRYQRSFSYFLMAFAVSEVLMALFSLTYRWIAIVSIAIVLASMILLIIYLKKNFSE